MSDPERYRSSAILREETLYYDLGYKFAQINGRKARKAFNGDVLFYLLLTTFIIQSTQNASQLYTILMLLILLVVKYSMPDRKSSPITLGLLIGTHVFDYTKAGIIALPGQILQERLPLFFWILEMIWIILLSYQILIIYQPYTPLIAEDQTVIPETREAKENYKKMKLRLLGSGYSVDPIDQVINTDRLHNILINLVKIVVIILLSGIILDIMLWRVIYYLGGGNNVNEEYLITGMSLILISLLVGFSHLMVADNEKE